MTIMPALGLIMTIMPALGLIMTIMPALGRWLWLYPNFVKIFQGMHKNPSCESLWRKILALIISPKSDHNEGKSEFQGDNDKITWRSRAHGQNVPFGNPETSKNSKLCINLPNLPNVQISSSGFPKKACQGRHISESYHYIILKLVSFCPLES